MDYDAIFNLLIVLGIAQGLFLAVLLLTRRENPDANRILAGAMVAFSVFLAETLLYRRPAYTSYPHFIGVSQPVIYLFGPTIYLYARELSSASRSFGRRSLLHFIPALAVTAYLLPFYLKSGAEKILFVDELMQQGSPLDIEIIEWLKLPHGLIYTLFTFRLLGIYRKRLEENFSSIDRINLRWLRNLLIGGLIVWVAAISQFIIGLGKDRVPADDLGLASLLLVGFVYIMGYLGLRQPEVFWPPAQELVGATPSPEPAASETSGKYRKSGLDDEKAEALMGDLLRLMDDDKPYTDPNLTLHQLAGLLSASPHNLSEIINTRLERSFHDFANGYRVDEAKRRLLDPALANRTILAIAIDSGFGSKSTFNKIFKKFTDATPSQFRQSP